MIRLGLRLTLNGGREAAIRLAITAVAVAVGVTLLLVGLAGMNALNAQNARSAWLNASGPPGVVAPPGASKSSTPAAAPPDLGTSNADPTWFRLDTDHFGGQTIDWVDVASTGPSSPVPPGLTRLPGPGQYVVSPALSRLLRSTPANELRDRFPGTEIGTMGRAGLPSPSSLVVVVGRRTSDLSADPAASQVTTFDALPGTRQPIGWDSHKLQTLLAVAVLALLFPVLIFIATATRLSAARREQRFAAMRLVGGTPRQVSVIAAVEGSVAAIAGVAIGFVAFFLLRPLLASVPFTGAPFFTSDLSLSPTDIAIVALGVPIAGAVAARLALRRVQISPLGVSRRTTPPDPKAYRLVPLVLGIAELAWFVDVGRPTTTGGQISAYFGGCLLIMVGLIIAGPWLTMVGSRVMARRTNRPAVLIAGRRLSYDPRAAFRAISGLIVALFVTSAAVGVVTTIIDSHAGPSRGALANDTLVDQVGGGPIGPGQPAATSQVSEHLLAELRAIPGVQGVTLVRDDPDGSGGVLASCDDLVHTPALGRCERGAKVVRITGDLNGSNMTSTSSLDRKVWPAASVSAAQLAAQPVNAVIVGTDGSTAALEHARTTLELAHPEDGPPSTVNEVTEQDTRQAAEIRQLTNVVIIISLVIAGCSLAVSVTAGVNDRKRPFSLLRLTGVPVAVLRRMVALEAAVPLVLIAIVSVGMGFVAAALFLRSQLDETLRAPGLDYYLLVIGGLLASLAIIASTLPLIERITGPETARNE